MKKLAKWADWYTIALRGDVIAVAPRFLLVPRATWKSYWVLLIIQSKPTRRGDMADVAFSGGKKEKKKKKELNLKLVLTRGWNTRRSQNRREEGRN